MIRFATKDTTVCPLCSETPALFPLSDTDLERLVEETSLCPWHDGEIESELNAFGILSEDVLYGIPAQGNEDEELDDASEPSAPRHLQLVAG